MHSSRLGKEIIVNGFNVRQYTPESDAELDAAIRQRILDNQREHAKRAHEVAYA
jgi:hypothetical protein